jgi:pimeloyl-ACP methyl ester carboxylesterase
MTYLLAAVACLTLTPEASLADDNVTVSPPGCADVAVFGLRGMATSTSDQGGFGGVAGVVTDSLKVRIQSDGHTYKTVGVKYVQNVTSDYANLVKPEFLASFEQEVQDGLLYLSHVLVQETRACPRERFVIIAHSMGAAIAHVFAELDPMAIRTDAIVLMGDPDHWPNTAYDRPPGNMGVYGLVAGLLAIGPDGVMSHDDMPLGSDRLASYCLSGDIVCDGSWLASSPQSPGSYGLAIHGRYGQLPEVRTAAVNFATGKVYAHLARKVTGQGNVYPMNTDWVRIHRSPGLAAPVIGQYGRADGMVPILEQCPGRPVDGNPVWDETDRGWVADAFVNTHVDGFLPGVPRC